MLFTWLDWSYGVLGGRPQRCGQKKGILWKVISQGWSDYTLLFFFNPHLRTFFPFLLEREEGREAPMRERCMDWLPPVCSRTQGSAPKLGIWGVWTWDGTRSLLLTGRCSLQPRHVSQALYSLCSPSIFSADYLGISACTFMSSVNKHSFISSFLICVPNISCYTGWCPWCNVK